MRASKARTRRFNNGAADKPLYPLLCLLCLLCLPQTKAFKGNFQSPVTFFTMPLANAVAREVSGVQLAAAGGDPEALAWQPQLVPFPHPQVRVPRTAHASRHSASTRRAGAVALVVPGCRPQPVNRPARCCPLHLSW